MPCSNPPVIKNVYLLYAYPKIKIKNVIDPADGMGFHHHLHRMKLFLSSSTPCIPPNNRLPVYKLAFTNNCPIIFFITCIVYNPCQCSGPDNTLRLPRRANLPCWLSQILFCEAAAPQGYAAHYCIGARNTANSFVPMH